jgi:hypothetical protein
MDLSPTLRELDENVEKIELGIRDCIVSTLENDAGRLPPHVAQKIEETIQKSAKKNPTIDAENYHELSKKLQFADLRHLQEIITSKASWQYFEPRFVNKVTLEAKFGQMAELRNCIRHSRTVDEVTRKEGEAALVWFKQVLNK